MKPLRKILAGKRDLESRLVAFYAFAAIAITLSFSFMISFYQAYFLSLILLLVSLNNLPVFFLLQKKIHFEKACFYLLANGAFTMALSISAVGGIRGPVVYWVALLPLAGGLMLQLQGIIYSAALSLLSILAISMREFFPDLIHDVLIPDLPYMIVSLCLFIGMIAFMAHLYLETNQLVVMQQTRKLDNLLNIVTHDIANPLTLISGHAEIMINQGQTKHTEALRRISRASDVINDILRKVRQIQAAKAGKLLVETSLVPLQDVFEKLRFIFENKLKVKQQTLQIDFPEALKQVRVVAEPVMLLNEVLCNLLSNAIKFSPIGSTIYLIVDRDMDRIRIEVQDHGIGIPGNLLPYIFDDFRSTSRQGTEGESGTGFGLPLAKHIMESFGGKLSVESISIEDQPTQSGSRFILLLRSDLEIKSHPGIS